MVDGIRLLTGAGLVPMLLFCFVFGALQTLDEWMWHAWRWALGPHRFETWVAASDTLGMVNALIVGVLSVVLIGAAVEHVTRDERQRLATAEATIASATIDTPAAETAVVTPA